MRPLAWCSAAPCSPYRPIARKSPAIEAQPLRQRVNAAPVECDTARRRECPGAVVSDISFRGSQICPIRGKLGGARIDQSWLPIKSAGSSLDQQLPDDRFPVLVLAFAELVIPNTPLRIDEIACRPVLVHEGSPNRVIAVDRDRMVNADVLYGALDVAEILLELELRRMNADHHQPVVLVLVSPGADIRQRASPVDAGIGPEVDQDDFSAQLGSRQWLRVEPTACAIERGKIAVDGQVNLRASRPLHAFDLRQRTNWRHQPADEHRDEPAPICSHRRPSICSISTLRPNPSTSTLARTACAPWRRSDRFLSGRRIQIRPRTASRRIAIRQQERDRCRLRSPAARFKRSLSQLCFRPP